MNLKRYKPLTMVFILTLNSLSFSIHSSRQILDAEWISYGFPLSCLTRVLLTFGGPVDFFCGCSLGAFVIDLIFWFVVTYFALRFLRVRKLPLPRNKLTLGILGIMIFALESFWVAFPKLHTGAFFWEALPGGTLMLAGFLYILSIEGLVEAKEKEFS